MNNLNFTKRVCAAFTCVFLSFSFRVSASNVDCMMIAPEDSDMVYSNPEVEPQFPDGGDKGLMQFLESKLRYPVEAQMKGIQGRVLVNFVVGADGSISDAKILRSVNRLLDEEALRVVSLMPKWIPGTIDGKAVDVKYTLPFSFKLPEEKLNGKKTPNGNFGFFPKRNEAIFGNYAKKKDRDGKDMFIFGVENFMHKGIKVTINNKLNTDNENLESTMASLVLGNDGSMEDAVKAYRSGFKAIKVEAASLTRDVNVKEYYTNNGFACVEYGQISQKDPANVTSPLYVIYDCNNNKIVSLSDLVSPKVADYLRGQGVEVESCFNIKVDATTFLVPTAKTVLTLDAVKLNANITDVAKSILGLDK